MGARRREEGEGEGGWEEVGVEGAKRLSKYGCSAAASGGWGEGGAWRRVEGEGEGGWEEVGVVGEDMYYKQ